MPTNRIGFDRVADDPDGFEKWYKRSCQAVHNAEPTVKEIDSLFVRHPYKVTLDGLKALSKLSDACENTAPMRLTSFQAPSRYRNGPEEKLFRHEQYKTALLSERQRGFVEGQQASEQSLQEWKQALQQREAELNARDLQAAQPSNNNRSEECSGMSVPCSAKAMARRLYNKYRPGSTGS